MATSLLQAFVTGTRAMLTAQLIVAVAGVALAGWTLGVTNQLIRERDRLQERVIQLEEAIAARGDIPPAPTAVVERIATRDADIVYPGALSNGGVASTEPRPDSELSSAVSALFAPPPVLRTVVLHVRAQSDVDEATRIGDVMQRQNLHVIVNVAGDGDQRPAGYAYFDGRQSRTASETVARFHEIAREQQIAQWAAQLRGTALPAQGEYTADRIDITLPALPFPSAPPPAENAAPPATTP